MENSVDKHSSGRKVIPYILGGLGGLVLVGCLSVAIAYESLRQWGSAHISMPFGGARYVITAVQPDVRPIHFPGGGTLTRWLQTSWGFKVFRTDMLNGEEQGQVEKRWTFDEYTRDIMLGYQWSCAPRQDHNYCSNLQGDKGIVIDIP